MFTSKTWYKTNCIICNCFLLYSITSTCQGHLLPGVTLKQSWLCDLLLQIIIQNMQASIDLFQSTHVIAGKTKGFQFRSRMLVSIVNVISCTCVWQVKVSSISNWSTLKTWSVHICIHPHSFKSVLIIHWMLHCIQKASPEVKNLGWVSKHLLLYIFRLVDIGIFTLYYLE